MTQDLEIPRGKRKPLYRFLEILPGLISYGAVILLFVFSWLNPVLGAVYLFTLISATLVKAIGVAYRTVQGYEVVKSAEKVNWRKRMEELAEPHAAYERLAVSNNKSYHFAEHLSNLKMMATELEHEYPDPERIYHMIIMAAYNEGFEILDPSVEAVMKSTFPNERIIFVLAYEERGGEAMRQIAKSLKAKYGKTFKDFLLIEHPANLPGEVVGKGPNLTYAGHEALNYVTKHKISIQNIIVTSLDSDNRVHPKYLDAVAYEFITHPGRQHLSYQPVALFTNNIWDAPAPTRVIAVSNSFFNVISTMRPHVLRNFASHSQPLEALAAMDFWSKRTIVEDGHQYWRSLFFFKGDYGVLPIRIPIYQDAVIDDTFLKTVKAQFIQVRRWYYGASDVAYVGTRLFVKRANRLVPFWQLFPKFMRLLDGHVTLAIMAPIITFGAWVPWLMNVSSHEMVAYNLPNIVSIIETIASIGLLITVLISFRMLPKRPAKYSRGKNLSMILQWILMPITSILYQSIAAYYAQTRLMLGLYMEKFDVTKKVIKK